MKTINVKSEPINEGRYGRYFQLSKSLEVKIYKVRGVNKLNLKTVQSQRIIQEATIGLLAGSTTKSLVVVIYKGKQYLGILQKHISLKSSPISLKDIREAKKSLSKNNVLHGDLHSGNLIKKKSGFIVLDFDPEYAFFIGKKQAYYTVKNRLIKELKG
jgi:hypothetical protein